MLIPDLIVIGTGRSGTHSLAEALGGEHEPNMFRTVQAAWQYVHRSLTNEQVTELLEQADEWPPVVVDYKMLELVPIVADLWPDAKFLLVTRSAKATVGSMVGQDWYNPADDRLPATHMWWWRDNEGRVEAWQDVNYAGHRTRADRLGYVTEEEWAGMGQVERCCWWWAHATRTAIHHLGQLPAGRWRVERIENIDLGAVGVWAGVEAGPLPHLDRTVSGWNPGWERWWQAWCEPLDTALGYRYDR